MPSTYSNLKIQLMATGENSTTWGNVTNVNLGTALEEAIVGSADVTFASGNVTLTLTDTNATQTARNMRLRCTGTTGGSTRNLVVPSIEKPYIVQNDCADSILVKTAAGSGITVPAGKTMWVYSNGTDVVDATTHLTSLTLGTALAVTQGGTGSNTASGARTNLGLGTISTQNSNTIAITGGSITGITDLAVADGGTGASTAAAARVSLLPSYATNALKVLRVNSGATDVEWTTATAGTVTSVGGTGTVNGVSLSGTVTSSGNLTLSGTLAINNADWSGTDLAVVNGGTGASDAATARSNLSAAASGANTDITALDQDVTITATGTIAADTLGFRGLPQNSQTSSYTLALADAGKHISITTGGVVIPANGSIAFPVGTTIVIFNNSGSTQTISITTDTLRQAGTANTGSRTLAVYGLATCVKVASTTWVISGTVT
jgi:hypothetical protein